MFWGDPLISIILIRIILISKILISIKLKSIILISIILTCTVLNIIFYFIRYYNMQIRWELITLSKTVKENPKISSDDLLTFTYGIFLPLVSNTLKTRVGWGGVGWGAGGGGLIRLS